MHKRRGGARASKKKKRPNLTESVLPIKQINTHLSKVISYIKFLNTLGQKKTGKAVFFSGL